MARIFIVDDEPSLHELYSTFLAMNGHEIVADAYDGNEAVKMFGSMDPPPEIVIMDHRMPNKNGIEATKELRGINSNVKIILASADDIVKDSALEAGACRFMLKPFNVMDLLAEIEEMVGA
ncbi:MAG: response regulator [Methanosarcinales archaeon]|jgi:two-component system chemotaxis response regulator CheY|nr:response regulator [Methanosarcinales archaeon]MCK4651685.1 response regulator [Methanosarcinales archaeon]MCK4810867.1 response regulator [Methanosarcinales archaeon]